jgi:hypothetical protein
VDTTQIDTEAEQRAADEQAAQDEQQQTEAERVPLPVAGPRAQADRMAVNIYDKLQQQSMQKMSAEDRKQAQDNMKNVTDQMKVDLLNGRLSPIDFLAKATGRSASTIQGAVNLPFIGAGIQAKLDAFNALVRTGQGQFAQSTRAATAEASRGAAERASPGVDQPVETAPTPPADVPPAAPAEAPSESYPYYPGAPYADMTTPPAMPSGTYPEAQIQPVPGGDIEPAMAPPGTYDITPPEPYVEQPPPAPTEEPGRLEQRPSEAAPSAPATPGLTTPTAPAAPTPGLAAAAPTTPLGLQDFQQQALPDISYFGGAAGQQAQAIQRIVRQNPRAAAALLSNPAAVAELQATFTPQELSAMFGDIGWSRGETNPPTGGQPQMPQQMPMMPSGGGGFAYGGLVNGPGYYQEGGDLEPPSPPDSQDGGGGNLFDAANDLVNTFRNLSSEQKDMLHPPLPRPRPQEAPQPEPQARQPLERSLGLSDVPPAVYGPRSIGTYSTTEPVPFAVGKAQLPPTVAPSRTENWDQWAAGLPESANVEDRRIPSEIRNDNWRWERSYRTTPPEAPEMGMYEAWHRTPAAPSLVPPKVPLPLSRPATAPRQQPPHAPPVRGLVNVPRNYYERQGGGGYQLGGPIKTPQLGVPAMNTAAKQAHFGALNMRPSINPPGAHLIHSAVPGRVDRIPMRARSGSFILPADVVSGLGQGNTYAGAKMWGQALSHAAGPAGVTNTIKQRAFHAPPMPSFGRAMGQVKTKGFQAGGETDELTPIVTSGGEMIVDPEIVAAIGGGDPEAGKKHLINSVTHVRKQTAKHLKSLPGPVQ